VISKTIVEQNPWWRVKDFERFDYDLEKYQKMIVHFSRKIPPLAKGRTYFIKGPRRSGKTIWLKLYIKHLIENGEDPLSILYLSCDRIPIVNYVQLMNIIREYLNIYKRESNFILIDEITRVNKWSYALKGLKDSGVLENCITVVTGSIPLLLTRGAELMPGRGVEGGEYYLTPVSFRKYIEALANEKIRRILKEKSFSLDESIEKIAKKISETLPYITEIDEIFYKYLQTGGFPEVVDAFLRKEKPVEEALEILLNYILGDIAKENRDPDIAKAVLIEISKNLSSIVTYATLAKKIGISLDTVKDYIKILEEMLVVIPLGKFIFSSKTSTLKGGIKAYFTDIGFYYAIKTFSEGKLYSQVVNETLTVEKTPIIVENIVVSHIVQHGRIPKLREPNTFIGYIKNKKETDILYKRQDGTLVEIEVKYRYKVKLPPVKRAKEVIIISRDSFSYDKNKKVLIVPVSVFLALLKDCEKSL